LKTTLDGYRYILRFPRRNWLLLRNIMPGDVNVTNIISFRNLKAMGALLSAKPRDDCLYPGSDRLPTIWRFQIPRGA
jgi:hypothetical protein